MNWMDEIGGILQQYNGAAAAPAPINVEDDFDQLAQTAPPSAMADGLAAAFRSDQTPPFGQMVGQLFGNSNGTQRAGILNTLLATLGPSVLSQVFGGGRGSSILGSILGSGQTSITPEQAERVTPEQVEQLAAQAEKRDPSIIDQFSNFYAEHPGLVKGLGAAALAIALSAIAQRHGGR
jgi:hypothetical protein